MTIELIDNLLKNNPYFNGKSESQRLDIYNRALRKLSEDRKYLYTNEAIEEGKRMFFQNMELQILSKVIPNAKANLIYLRLAVQRVGTIRAIQKQVYYQTSNIKANLIAQQPKILELLVKQKIQTIVVWYISKMKSMELSRTIVDIITVTKERILKLPIIGSALIPVEDMITTRIIPVLSSIITPVINSFIITKAVTLTKTLLDKTSILYSFSKVLPFSRNIMTIEEYQYLSESTLTLPITKSILGV